MTPDLDFKAHKARAFWIAQPHVVTCGPLIVAVAPNDLYANRITELLNQHGLIDIPNEPEDETP